MADSASPVTANELLQTISSLVRSRAEATGRPIHGSWLADALRRSYPALNYSTLGLARLSDAIDLAEKAGLVSRNRNVHHLEVIPGPSSAPPLEEPKPSTVYSRRRNIRADIWRAVVLMSPSRLWFFDRSTGRVLDVSVTDTATVENHRSGQQFVELPSIPPEVEKSWLKGFCTDSQLDLPISLLDTPDWWRRIPAWLRGQGVERLWRSFRAKGVIEFIEAWARTNNVPMEAIYEDPPLDPRKFLLNCQSPTLLARTDLRTNTDSGSDVAGEKMRIRRALLAALGEMTTDELIQLDIPVRYVLRYFRVK